MKDGIKKTTKNNSRKGYRTKNAKTVKNKYFSVNSSTVNSFSNNMNLSFGSSGNGRKKYLSTEEILNILRGSNGFYKQQTINDLSDFFYNTNGVYASLIDKIVGVPCFDRVVARGDKQKLKTHYLKMIRSLDDKFVGKDALNSVMRTGVYFGYLSYLEENDNANAINLLDDSSDLTVTAFSDLSIIPLSPKYTRILSTDGKTYRIGIDVSQLTNDDLRGFPREIYESVKLKRSNYKESINKKEKTTSIFALQYYILDEKKTIVIKNRAGISESSGRAQFVTTIIELIHDMNLGKKKSDILPKVGKDLVYETYPEGVHGKGTSSLTQTQMDTQHDFIADALNDLSTFSDTQMVSIHPGTKLDKLTLTAELNKITSDDILKRLGTHSGISMGFLNGENLKSDKTLLYLYEVMASEVDMFMVQFEKELNKVLRYTIKSKKDIIYPYISYLPTTRLNRKDYVEMYHKMFIDAGGSYQMYLASAGIAPEIQINLMEEEEDLGFRDKFPAHPMASTISNKAEDVKGLTDSNKQDDIKEEVVEDTKVDEENIKDEK